SQGGAMLQETVYYYDGATTWDAVPSRGTATRTAHWLNTTGAFLPTDVEYDGYGNVTAEIDAAGGRTSYILHGTFHQFIVSTQNALGHTSTADWDFVCGQQSQAVNANGQVATMQYDALCRLASAFTPLGGFEIRSRPNLGDPQNQYEQVESPGADGTG